ncbi:IF2 family translation initiation factor [Rhodococcus sp. CH91]|uniref:IF2 family translation initiation factor n=1 Tax=Rhodococcus sp. CH91 TaxID=2910256 RepID=UPI001F4A1B90|nr:IF2 family translation initiation factor [Rhodococcus sp. CH91]
MNLIALPRNVLRLQYRIARFPLGLIEQQLRFLPTDAPPRLVYERGLGMLDGIVGSLLDDRDIATRGALATERADAVRRADKLDAQAAAEKRAADAELRRTRERAAAEQEDARRQREEEVRQARERAQERAQQAEKEAEQKKAAETAKAEQEAQERRRAAEAEKKKDDERIREAEKDAAEPAKISLKDAVAKQLEAKEAEERAHDAGELVDYEKIEHKHH